MLYPTTDESNRKWNDLHKLIVSMGISSECRNTIFTLYLEDILKSASVAYYRNGETIMTDEVYDQLEDNLRTLNPDSELLKKVGTK